MKTLLLILPFFVLLGCKKDIDPALNVMETSTDQPATLTATQKTYLALGDSYTIGESVTLPETYSYQLADSLRIQGVNIATPKIFAKTGWTTGDLLKAIAAQGIYKKYDLVTLLIGVNNQYRGQSQSVYRTEFKKLLQMAIGYANGNKSHVIVISIPDWGVTPFGKKSGRSMTQISKEIDQFNAINKEEALTAQVNYVNVITLSRKANTYLSLVASDGLHYSGKMYGQWSDVIFPAAYRALK
jgi:lysophospholipase L1-like esterase